MEIEFDEVLRASPLIKELINNQKAKKRKIYYEVSREFLAAGYQVRLWFDGGYAADELLFGNLEVEIKKYFYEWIKDNIKIKLLAERIINKWEKYLIKVQIIDLSERHGVVLYNQEKD